MKFLCIAVALCAFSCIVSSQRLPNGRRIPVVKRTSKPSGGQGSQGLRAVSQQSQTQSLRPRKRIFTPKAGFNKPLPYQPRPRPHSFEPSPTDTIPQFEEPSERFVPYQPRPEYRPQNKPKASTEQENYEREPVKVSATENEERAVQRLRPDRPSVFLDKSGERLFRKPRPSSEDVDVPETAFIEVLKKKPLKPQKPPTPERKPQYPVNHSFKPIESYKVDGLKNPEIEEPLLKTPNIFDFSKEIQPFSKEVEEYQVKSNPKPLNTPIKPYRSVQKPPQVLAHEDLVKIPKRKKVVPQDIRFDKDFKKDKREIIHHGEPIDPYGAQFAEEVEKVEHAGNKHGRVSFQLHGLKGPHSYRFGFDTGKGHNRQFRYEERDNYGEVKGRYGYLDKHGKLHVVNYSAHPKYGFSADLPKY